MTIASRKAAALAASIGRSKLHQLPSTTNDDVHQRVNVAGDVERVDLDKLGCEHHWQRPDGSVYAVDSSD